MTKTDLINSVASRTSMTKADSDKSINALLDSVRSALAKGEKVTLTGFGTFEVRKRAARTGRNPRTGQVISIPATKTPAFRAGKGLKEAVK